MLQQLFNIDTTKILFFIRHVMRHTLLHMIMNPLRKICNVKKITKKFTKLVHQTKINVFCTVHLQQKKTKLSNQRFVTQRNL